MDWFLNNLAEILLGLIIGSGITILYNYCKQRYWKAQLKSIFGDDVTTIDNFYLVYGEFILSNPIAKFLINNNITHPYQKSVPVFTNVVNAFSITNPISIAEVRAANYLSSVIGTQAKNTPILSPDINIKDKLDLSFISFGGPGGNHKTNDIIINGSNTLVNFDGSQIISKISGKSIITSRNLTNEYNYGLILKIHPKQHSKRVWIMCAGFGEWGTSGAAYYLANKWKEIYKWAKSSDFAIIVKVRNGQDESVEELEKLLSSEEPKVITKLN